MNALTLVTDRTPPDLVPSLSSVSESYAELHAKRAALWEKLGALRADQAALGIELRERGVAGHGHPDPAEHARRVRVAELIGDPAPAPVSPQDETAETRFRAIAAEIKLVEEAVEAVERRMREAAGPASLIVCKKIKGEYEKRVTAVLKAMLALHVANAEYIKLTDALARQDISWSSLKPIFPRFIGSPDDPHGPLRQFIYEAIEDGWLNRRPAGGYPLRGMKMEYSTSGFITQVDDVAMPADNAVKSFGGIRRIGGYATRYNKPHEYKGSVDVFLPGAFTASLAAKNLVKLLEEHSDVRTLATTNGGGLELRSDDVGLAFLATLPSTADGERVYDLVKSHQKTAMSVAYHVLDAEQKLVAGEQVRFIRSANLQDVSLCRTGAVKQAYAEAVEEWATEPKWESKAAADVSAAHAQMMQALQAVSDYMKKRA